MLISKSKSMLLKSIAMILTLIMVVCVCLTACADNEARKTANDAKEIAEKAQQNLDEALKNFVSAKDVSGLIETALKDFAAGDGKTLVTDVLQSEAGSTIIGNAVAAAVNEKLAGLQTADDVKALIEAALTSPDGALNQAIQAAMAQYITAESAKTLVSEALDEYLETVLAKVAEAGYQTGDEVSASITEALEAYKATVSALISEKVGENVGEYLASEEAAAVINAYIAQYQSASVKNAVDTIAKLYETVISVSSQRYTSADMQTMVDAFNEKISPILDATWGETDIVTALYVASTVEPSVLNKNVDEFIEVCNSCESMEAAAAKIDAMIAELGVDVNGNYPSNLVDAALASSVTAPGKFGYVIVIVDSEAGEYIYYTTGSLAKLAADLGDATVYEGYDLIVANYGSDTENYFSKVINDNGEWTAIEVEAVIAPTFDDADKILEIEAALDALVAKFMADYPDIAVEVPAVPDDLRTEENEYEPAYYVYNPAYGVVNYDFYGNYIDMIDTIVENAMTVMEKIEDFAVAAGEEGENITPDAKTWPEYLAVVDAYAAYEASRFDNVIEGVAEMYNAFIAGVDEAVAAAEQAAIEAQLKAWADGYQAQLDAYTALYFEKVLQETIPAVRYFAAVYTSPIYGVGAMVGESQELNAWAAEFTADPYNNFAFELTPFGTIDSAEKYSAALADLYEQFYGVVINTTTPSEKYTGFFNDLDNLTSGDGYVKVALDEIDAKWWYTTVQSREIANIQKVLIDAAFVQWNTTGAGAVTNDMYDTAVAYFKTLENKIANYDIELAKVSNPTTPYSSAIRYFLEVSATADAELRALEKFYDTRYTVFGTATVPSPAPAPSTYVSYAAKLINDLTVVKDTLLAEYNPTSARDEYEYDQYRRVFLNDYNQLVSAINAVTPANGYVAALEALDAQYEAAARKLQKDVYEMKIDRKMVVTEQAVNEIFGLYYASGVGAELFADYYAEMMAIVNEYQANIIPSEVIDAHYAGTDDDAVAYNNAIAAIENDYNQALIDLASKGYQLKLIDLMDALQEEVDDYQATATEGTKDSFGLFDPIKEQIDEIVGGDAILNIDTTTTTTGYVAEANAAFLAKKTELTAAVDAYKALIDSAVAKTTDFLDHQAANVEAAEDANDATLENYARFDYKNALSNMLAAAKRNINDVVIVRPFHMEDDPNSTAENPLPQIKVYDVITDANLTAAYNTAIAAVDAALAAYEADLAAYEALMDEYRQMLEALENKKAQLTAIIDGWLKFYTEEDPSGNLVEFGASDLWNQKPAIFEVNSPIYLGLLAAKEALADVTLEMVKPDVDVVEYWTPAEAYANAVARNTGLIYQVLAANVVDEPGITSFLSTLNRRLG